MADKISEVVMLENVRLSFPHLAEPQVNDKGKKNYGALLIMEPDHPGVAAVKKAMVKVAKQKWPNKYEDIVKQLKAAHKLCLKPGELKAGDYDGFDGMLFVSANNGARPKILNRAGEPVGADDEQFPYSGCYVIASIGIWPQDHVKHGKRINAELRGVRFLKDGESFGGGGVADDDELGGKLSAGADDDMPEDDEDDLV